MSVSLGKCCYIEDGERCGCQRFIAFEENRKNCEVCSHHSGYHEDTEVDSNRKRISTLDELYLQPNNSNIIQENNTSLPNSILNQLLTGQALEEQSIANELSRTFAQNRSSSRSMSSSTGARSVSSLAGTRSISSLRSASTSTGVRDLSSARPISTSTGVRDSSSSLLDARDSSSSAINLRNHLSNQELSTNFSPFLGYNSQISRNRRKPKEIKVKEIIITIIVLPDVGVELKNPIVTQQK